MTASTQLLSLKLLLAPSLVALVSILTARFGPRMGGILGAFPMVSGPILLLFAIEQGLRFTAQAATRTLYGTLSLVAYCLAYGYVASRFRRSSPFTCLLVGWGVFLIFTFLLEAAPGSRLLGAPFALGSVLLGLMLLPRPRAASTNPSDGFPKATHHLLSRMGAAALLVFSLSEAAQYLGPKFSGLLTPFPVASTVLLVATHFERSTDEMLGWLHGFMVGLFGYVTFIGCIALMLEHLKLARTFSTALGLAVAVQVMVTHFGRRASVPSERPAPGEVE